MCCSLVRLLVELEHDGPVVRMEFSGDGYLLGMQDADGKLRIHSILDGSLITEQLASPYSASLHQTKFMRGKDYVLRRKSR